MKFNEIWDPSRYRPGDEHNPGSPDYEDVGEEFDNVMTLRNYELGDEQGDLIGRATVQVRVRAHREGPSAQELGAFKRMASRAEDPYDLDSPGFGQWKLESIKLVSVTLQGQSYEPAEALAKFGDIAAEDHVHDAVLEKLEQL